MVFYLSFYLSIYLSINQSIYLCIFLSIYSAPQAKKKLGLQSTGWSTIRNQSPPAGQRSEIRANPLVNDQKSGPTERPSERPNKLFLTSTRDTKSHRVDLACVRAWRAWRASERDETISRLGSTLKASPKPPTS